MTSLDKSLASLKDSIAKREETRIVQLPLWYDHQRGLPNTFPRSELFAAIQGKDRKYLKKQTLASNADFKIVYTGEQLDQSDLDVWEQAVHLARGNPLGNICLFSAHSFLKQMGRNTGKSDHAWLESVFTRLTACEVQITRGEHDLFAGNLIHERMRAGPKRIYRMVLNKKLINLFGEKDFTRLDWQQRRQLTRKPLALWLHAFYSTHYRPFDFTAAYLLKISGSANKCPRDFRRKLKAALEELVKIGFLAGYMIEGEKVKVHRVPAFGPTPQH